MEKIMMPLWKPAGVSIEDFSAQLLQQLSADLIADENVLSFKMCIDDEHVKPAASYRMLNIITPAYDAMLIAWLNAGDQIFSHKEKVDAICQQHHVYIVCESDRLPLDYSDVPSGHKTEGMNEIVALQVPDWLERDEWLKIWHESHTQIAIDTQSTYGYRQNVVLRSLTSQAPHVDAFIEENFPEAAIHGRLAFYDTDDEAVYKAREQTMIESVARFIDFEKIDCIPTSEYIMK